MEEIKVIYQDKDLLILDKPAGWVTTKEKSKSQSLNPKNIENWLEINYPNGLPREGIAHRLDKGTSGILITAKNAEALKKVKQAIKERKMMKKYLALVSGDFPFKARLEMPIKRSSFKFDHMIVKEDGKMAITGFKLIQKYRLNGKIYSLVEADLKTGRTHQIRVHLSYLKWPIVGDVMYGGPTTDSGLNRPFLHAFYLEFSQPTTGKKIVFQSELPADLKEELEQYEKI